MTWQEYQKAVGTLYQNIESKSMGEVKYNIYIPDKVSGQNRQIDVWWELNVQGHKVNILIDAKYRKCKIDVKDVEEVEALASSVKANKVIIVTNNGWTESAFKKAEFSNTDLKILDADKALDLIIPDKWFMCYNCTDECVIMDSDGVLYREGSGLFFDWYAGKCRSCGDTYFHCPECGSRKILEDGDKYKCYCKHKWKKENEKLFIKFNDLKNYKRIDNAPEVPVEFLFWVLGYSREYWAKLVLATCNIPTDKENTFTFMIGLNGEIVKPDFFDEDGPAFYIPIN